MKLRYYILGTITIVLALAYRGCQPSYTNIPNTSDLDFSKKVLLMKLSLLFLLISLVLGLILILQHIPKEDMTKRQVE